MADDALMVDQGCSASGDGDKPDLRGYLNLPEGMGIITGMRVALQYQLIELALGLSVSFRYTDG